MLMGFRSKVNFTTDNKKPPVKVALLTLVQCNTPWESVFVVITGQAIFKSKVFYGTLKLLMYFVSYNTNKL